MFGSFSLHPRRSRTKVASGSQGSQSTSTSNNNNNFGSGADDDAGREVRRRRRLVLTCVQCRRLKVKCDRQKPCAHCKNHGRADVCTYLTIADREKERAWRERHRPPSTAIADVGQPSAAAAAAAAVNGNDITTGVTATVPVAAAAAAAASVNASSTSVALSAETAPVSSLTELTPSAFPAVQTPPTTSSLPSPSSRFLVHRSRFDRQDESEATNKFETDIDRQKKWKSRIRGSVHWSRFIREFELLAPNLSQLERHVSTLKDYRNDKGSQVLPCSYPFCFDIELTHFSRERCIREMPSQAICDHLTSNYMRSIETIFRMYHVPTMESEIGAFWDEPDIMHNQWIAQYFIILAVGLKVGEDPLTRDLRRRDPTLQAFLYRSAQWHLFSTDFTDRPTVEIVRSLCMIVLAKQLEALSFRHSESTVSLVAMIIRSAMTIKLHEQTPGSAYSSHLDAEIGRRLWATISALELQQELTTGLPPLIDPGDFNHMAPLNINDSDLIAFGDPPTSRDERTYTETTVQRLHSLTSHTAYKVMKAVNSTSRRMTYDEVLEYDERVRYFFQTARSFYEWFGKEYIDTSKIRLPLVALDVFFRRLLLALHSHYAQEPESCTRYPVSYWTSLECSLALLVLQRQLCEDPDDLRGKLWFVDLYKPDFVLAAVIVCVQLRRQESFSIDLASGANGGIGNSNSNSGGGNSNNSNSNDSGNSGEHASKSNDGGDSGASDERMRLTIPPRATILQTLVCCVEIWRRWVDESVCHLHIYTSLARCVEVLESETAKADPTIMMSNGGNLRIQERQEAFSG